MKTRTFAAAAALAAACISPVSQAAWPERPITFIVPYAAAGINDNSARITAQWLSRALKQNVIVENRTGANGAIAAEYVARAPADGYTLFMTASPTMVIVPHMQKVNYDPFRSFVPIAIMDAGYVAFAAHPSLPVKTFSELVAYAKPRPNKLDYATGASGSTGHLSMALLLKQAGITSTHVPYKGSSAAVVAVLGGHVPLYVGTLSDGIEHHKSGKLRIIGVSSTKRQKELPDVPTIAEQGYPGYTTAFWNALLAPAGTPREVIATIAEALKGACRDTALVAKYQQLSVEALCIPPEQFSQRLRVDSAMWEEAVKASGVAAK
ncbi:MAG: tripartite tricarboxylate transporter substrate binding protein [Betaproteobacteria bacterium]|nr:tripartite tricarboxylate transporter substrate binding protein [Betaproteobacteria bacterium]